MTLDHDPIAPPGPFGMLQELRLPLDALRWAPDWLRLDRRPVAQPRTVVLLPGFGAGPGSLRVMAAVLRRRGHEVSDWGLGRNSGRVGELLAALQERLALQARQSGHRLALVGWSLGGYLAREAARDRPELVRKVITLGSPVVGGPSFTAVAAWYRARGHDLCAIERQVAARYDTPLRVPVAAIYSKRDGVVAWQACIDHWSPRVRHIEVSETHLGLGFAPRVLGIVADELETD